MKKFKIKRFAIKKLTCILALVVLLVNCVCGCSLDSKTSDKSGKKNGKLQIVTTIFPEYDWVMNVLGDNPAGAEVTMLLDDGVDLHSYQPTAEDILKISTCDMFVYVGGESDGWVEDALKEATNKDMVVINLMDVLKDSVKEEEVVEGMEEHDHDDDADAEDEHDDADAEDEHEHDDAEDEHEHDDAEEEHDHDDAEEEHDHEHEEGEVEYDEHVWLSLKSAISLTESISDSLQKIDEKNKKTYEANEEAYVSKLSELDKKYEETVSAAYVKTLLFGDRFPFRYMVDDYDLDYFAAFVGCSAETEASFETISFLAKKVDELSLKTVLTIESSDQKIAKTIVDNTKDKNQEILVMDSMQSVKAEDVEKGTSYYSIMEGNLDVLKKALQ